MGSRNEEEWCGFSVDPSHMAVMRVMFSKDVFIQKQKSVKATVKLKTRDQQKQVHALIDSGVTDNFIDSTLANRFKFPLMKLEKPRVIRNVDGTRNSLGSVTHAAKLEVSYGTHKEEQDFFIINLGGDEMLLGYPFLRFTNPPIGWQKGTFYGNVHITTNYNSERYEDEGHNPELY